MTHLPKVYKLTTRMSEIGETIENRVMGRYEPALTSLRVQASKHTS